ncbi:MULTISPECIES: Rrf2 family transcriptional regulator [unclassified Siphonobacter]|uniref:RrF2 family transcriptional regulator n=1 Tax=unclassified Siphonobacter TaxID=2635712 RepID=UPI0027873312|nr:MULTISPECIES: Rrf2 family transcriptional regulator [unclassified Siphonobacter]MDQ1090582.1 Rrf2 family protein [Siphonobacter sp. SORGH_AS_1065]MDR6198087.1 Rrf2 family protein [Siphonobacter sp. SORGH_AS_0500]
MNNVRFATALHILTLLQLNKEQLLSSEFIANSININPAVVRKEIRNLRAYGFVESKEGKGGGYCLGKPASKIPLSEVYRSINISSVLGRSNTPNPDCPIGKQINTHLTDLFASADAAFLKQIGKITVEDFSKKFS